ncbi:MAG: penicillin acylase family protein [Candidatus Riflebacteria bacterium]|nr:penicillin acylase family protein [Candidatus Riflebacteria bacterium]
MNRFKNDFASFRDMLYRLSCATFIVAMTFMGTAFAALAPTEEIPLCVPNEVVQIRRDAVGAAHIVASSTEGAYWGFGYITARDRMMQLELLRRSVKGKLSELFGPSFLETDFTSRRDGVSLEELKTGRDRAPMEFRRALSAFTAGINRAIKDAREHRFAIDPGFAALGIAPESFDEIDILELFAGTMAVRYNDFTQELDNLHMLGSLVKKFGARTASNIFEDVVFYQDPQVYTTLGDVGSFPVTLRRPPHLYLQPPVSGPLESPAIRHRKRGRQLKSLGIPEKSGSYAAAVSNLSKGRKEAFMLGGPQMGYFKPSALIEIGLHAPGLDLVGTTPVGYFVILFGANRKIAFTATAGVSNLVDLISLRHDTVIPDRLLGGGFELTLASRTESITVKGQSKPVLRPVETTKLGPVIASESGSLIVKNRGWQDRVVDSYAGWFDSNHAQSLNEWLNASDRMALSINWLGADTGGHIGYVSCGVGKSRRAFGDDRLPGDQPTEFTYPDRRLAGVDPATGFFANWNCPPANGFRNGDLIIGWGRDQRTAFLADLLKNGRDRWSFEFLREVDENLAFTDLRARFFRKSILDVMKPEALSPDAHRGFEILSSWNDRREDKNGDGLLDNAGAGLFDLLWKELTGALFDKPLADFAWMVGSDPTWTQSSLLFDALAGRTHFNYLGNKTAADVADAALEAAVAKLASPGKELPLLPMPPMEFAGVNHVGVPTQTSPATFTPFMNRGSDVAITQLSSDGVRIWGVLPPGNAATGRHERDQIEDFRAFRYHERPVRFSDVIRLTKEAESVIP